MLDSPLATAYDPRLQALSPLRLAETLKVGVGETAEDLVASGHGDAVLTHLAMLRDGGFV